MRCDFRCSRHLDPVDEVSYWLIMDTLIADIQSLTFEVVKLRRELASRLPVPEAAMVHGDIFSNLGGRYTDVPCYQKYVDNLCAIDPLEADAYVAELLRLGDCPQRD